MVVSPQENVAFLPGEINNDITSLITDAGNDQRNKFPRHLASNHKSPLLLYRSIQHFCVVNNHHTNEA